MEKITKFLTLPATWFWPLIIIFEGFVTIAIEILTIRQVIPFVGSSVIVTSVIIGIFLLFLALGYHHGGKVTTQFNFVLRRNFIFTAVWFGIGLSYLFLDIFFRVVSEYLTNSTLYALTLYLLLVIAPLIYCLGQTVPLTMNMFKQDQSAGKIGGNVLGVSTIGSFLGATLTTLVLMQYAGVGYTIFFNVMLLLILVILLEPTWVILSILLGSLWLTYQLNIATEKSLFERANEYANYQILTSVNGDQKILSINNALSSHTDNQKHGFPYIEIIKKILFQDLSLANADILILGAGGFSLSDEDTFRNHFVYVDIDPQIKNIIVPKFIDTVKGDFKADDARHFIHRDQHKYDAILVDAYNALRSIPAYLLTTEFMQELKKHLQANGTVIFNIIARPTLSDAYSKRVDNTIRHTFKNCMSIPTAYTNRLANLIYVCSNSVSEKDNVIYSDRLNTATSDSFAWQRE